MGAEFDGVGGEIFAEEWQRLTDQLAEQDRAEAREHAATSAGLTDVGRSWQQRRLDALVEMARRSSAMPASARPSRPLCTVVIGLPELERACELARGHSTTPGQLVPWLAEADIERIVFDGASRAIDVGVRRRLFAGATRRAVLVRDRWCFHPSCDVPAARCEVDHRVPYGAGGLTRQDNGRCACKFHNLGRHRAPPP